MLRAVERAVAFILLALGMERRDHGEDHFTVLHRVDVAGRERTAVAVAVYLQDHRQVALSRPQEVPVQRVGEAVVLDGCRRRDQTLRRYLPAIKRAPRPEVRVAGAEQVAVNPFEIQARRKVVGQWELVHAVRAPWRWSQ